MSRKTDARGGRVSRRPDNGRSQAVDAQTALEYLRGDLDDVEALAHAGAEAANELPHVWNREQRRKVGRGYALVHLTFRVIGKLVGERWHVQILYCRMPQSYIG